MLRRDRQRVTQALELAHCRYDEDQRQRKAGMHLGEMVNSKSRHTAAWLAQVEIRRKSRTAEVDHLRRSERACSQIQHTPLHDGWDEWVR